MSDRATESIIDLAREGYTVTLGPSPLGGRGLRIEVVGGDLQSRKVLSDVEIDHHRSDAVAMMLDRIIGEFGEALEREVRGDEGAE